MNVQNLRNEQETALRAGGERVSWTLWLHQAGPGAPLLSYWCPHRGIWEPEHEGRSLWRGRHCRRKPPCMGAGARRSLEGQEEWRPQVTAGAPLLAPACALGPPTCVLGPLLAWPERPHGACRGDMPGCSRRVDEQALPLRLQRCGGSVSMPWGCPGRQQDETPRGRGRRGWSGGAAQHGQREHRLSAPHTLGLAPERQRCGTRSLRGGLASPGSCPRGHGSRMRP